MEEWKEYYFEDCIETIIDNRGKSAPTKNTGVFPLLEINAIGEYFPNYDVVRKFVDESTYYNWFRSGHPQNGDILIPTVGTIGIISLMDNTNACIAQNLIAVRIKENFSNIYIYYFLRSSNVKKQLLNLNIGGVQPSIKVPHPKKLKILLPSKKTQDKIASILKSLDDKIEVNRKINENLEQQAQALFKSWFVDFEPFKNGEFVESELGMIPKSLETKYVSKIPHVLETGRRPRGGVGELTSGIPSVGAEHVKGMGKYDFSKTKFIPEEYALTLKTGKVKGYELLIYKDGGKPGYFIPNFSIFGEGYPFDECYLNEHVFKLDFDNRGYNIFCYFFFQTDQVMTYLNAQGGKAAIPGINRQDIENILIFSPKNEQVKMFGTFVEPLFTKILYNCKESQKLATIRDTLLPKLMSGELKVTDVI